MNENDALRQLAYGVEKQQQSESTDTSTFIEKEVDMGFFDNHCFQSKDGTVQNSGCQRISYCSCDCNRCFLPPN